MDSYEGNKFNPNMSNAITKIISNKVVKYDLNIFTNVNIREKSQDSTPLKEETSLGICDNKPSDIIKPKTKSSFKKTKSHKENLENNVILQYTTKPPRKKLNKSSTSAATGRIIKRAIEFKSPQSLYASLNVSREMCQKQLERLKKQNLSQMVLTQDEINKLYMKYKLDGHFQVKSSNQSSNSSDKDNITANKFCDTYNTNSAFEDQAQKKNVEFNERNTYSVPFRNEDTSKYVQHGDKNLCHSINKAAGNLHFTDQAILPFPQQENSLGDGVCTENFYNGMQQNGNIFNTTNTEDTCLDFDAARYKYNNPNMHAPSNEAWPLGNGIQQYKNPNEVLLNNSHDVNRVVPPLNTLLDPDMNNSYKNVSIFANPESIQNIPDHSMTNQLTQDTFGQNPINSKLMMSPTSTLNPVLMGTHNIPLSQGNIGTAFDNSFAKNAFMNENEFHNRSNSYSMSERAINLNPPIKVLGAPESSFLHNDNFDYTLGNNYNNNIICNNQNLSTVSWQCDNTLSNAQQISEMTFSAVSNTINMLSIGEQGMIEYNANGAACQ